MRDGTRVVHAGLPEPAAGEPFLPGPALAAPFHAAGDPREAPYAYTRSGNPTFARLEQALGELEGGEAVLFASGMAAVAAVLLTRLRPGDAAVISADSYFGTRELATTHLAERGVEVRLVEPRDSALAAALPGARLALVETPSNPGLAVCDIAALAGAARAAGALLCVDNTLMTPLGQRPLDLGADVSLASGTKALSGHSDLVLGYVATRDPRLAAELRAWRVDGGAVPGPFEAWLAHRSLATLDLRLRRQGVNALALAEALAGRDDVAAVRYPGLPGDPAHAAAARQQRHFGCVVTFDLGGRERAERFLGACRLVAEATSFGGVHSSAERRARWGGDQVPEGFVRLSAGCEDAEDLVADVEQALRAAAP